MSLRDSPRPSRRFRPPDRDRPVRIGVVGTGFVSRHFAMFVQDRPGFEISRVLTRRPLGACDDHPAGHGLTDSLADLLDRCDVVLECSGDPIHATDVVDAACRAGRPVVTMNSEFHVTAGSYFVDRGLVTEADGDQPGSLAALREEALNMGFRPLVYGNLKGFQKLTPTPDDMAYWAARNGISVPMTTSFTDGTKIQFEQALVANGCGATLAVPGMLGPAVDDLGAGALLLAERAKALGEPISDYILSPRLPHGVFVVAEHSEQQRDALRYFKLGDGPYYTLLKPNILVHLEILKTVKRVIGGGGPLLNNSERPRIGVATIAKHDLAPGTRIETGIGSFAVRGSAVDIVDNAGHLPIGLAANAVLTRRVEAGQVLALADVEIPETLTLKAWREVEGRALTPPSRPSRESPPD